MDPIADMFTGIRNAYAAGKESAVFPYSKIKMEIAKLLQKEGYVKKVLRHGRKTGKKIDLELLYKDSVPVLKKIKRVSKPSRRVYFSVSDLYPLGGTGKRIVSTSKGIMTDKDARKAGLGGEVMGEIW